MYIQLPFPPFPNCLGKGLLGRGKTQGAGMSHPRAFCYPHLGLSNAAKCLTSPPTATAIRTWGFFCYFFVAVYWIWVCFKNVRQSLRDSWGYFHLLRNFSLCHSSCPPSAPDVSPYWHISKLLFSWVLEEWKAAQSKPEMSLFNTSVTNYVLFPHGRKTYLCLQKRWQTEEKRNFQTDTWR